MRRSLVGGVVVLGLAGLFAVGCGGSEPAAKAPAGEPKAAASGGATINVGLKEFAIEPDAKTAKPGSVTFKATNKGTTPHELIVVKTDLTPDKLPIKEAKADLTGLTAVATTPEIASGKSESKTADLTAGKYLLICNIPAHFQAGMVLPFNVQ